MNRLFYHTLLLVSLLTLAGQSFAEKSPLRLPGTHSERVHHTTIKATLNTETHLVDASMQLKWKNLTGVTLNEIPFHLYLNAFSSTDTPFMIESNGGSLRSDKKDGNDKENFGYTLVTKLNDENGQDLSKQWQMTQDVALLTLLTPLQPNEELILNFEFKSQLPKVFARSGHNGDTFNFVAQWFPKPGVWQNGTWVNHRYHAHSEFFADFGNYHVEMTVPKEFIVGATGVLIKQEANENLITYAYQAADVHDFVWTADSNYGEAETEWNGLNVRLLYQKPLNEESINNQLEAAVASFKWFDEIVGSYPYSTMTIVQPPEGAGGASGMEYPTLITTSTNIEKSKFQESAAVIVIHEVGHNYWQGIMASNEFEESWMDEGINSYTEGRILSESMGRDNVLHLGRLKVNLSTAHRLGAASSKNIDPVKTKSWNYIDSSSYGSNSYSKPATILNTVERIWGTDKINLLLSSYYQAWSFKHPNTEDFLSIAQSIDPAMGDYLRRAITTTEGIDLSVHKLVSKKAIIDGGFDLTSTEFPLPFTKPDEAEDFSNKVTLRRLGNLYPEKIQVQLRYADDQIEVREWTISNNVNWVDWQWRSKEKLVEVIIDPQFQLLLDSNFSNNIKRSSDQSNESWRWAIILTQSLQNALTALLPL